MAEEKLLKQMQTHLITFCFSCFQAVIFEPQPIQIPDISSFSSEEVNKVLRKDLKMGQKKKEKGIKYISVPEIGNKSIYTSHWIFL